MSGDLQVDVAVVGGGPSGLACATALRARGVGRVLVLEREAEPGGAVRHCGHPAFGLREFGRLMGGPAYVRRLQGGAIRAGVDVRTRHSVVALHAGGQLDVASPEGLLRVSARRVVLAMGARETPCSARLVSGERPLGVMNTAALQACIYLEGLKPFTRPIIVGTELVGLLGGLDLPRARGATRGGGGGGAWADGGMAARPLPHLLGVPVYYGAEIADIAGRPRVQSVAVRDAAGALRRIDGDGVVFSGRFRPESALLASGVLEVDEGSGGPSTDQYGRCSEASYFAVGTALRAIETAGWCYREGRRTGLHIADDLAGRLSAAGAATASAPWAGIKLTSPQVLSLPLANGSACTIQARASETLAGRLTLRADEQAIWSRRRRLVPEQCILVPAAPVGRYEGCTALTLSLD